MPGQRGKAGGGRASAADARANGITSTPSVIVNGALQNWRDWDQVQVFLDAELAKSEAEQ